MTLWAACRTTVLGSVVIVVGLLMTALGYFDSELSQEERYDKGRKRKEAPLETKHYLFRSLQFFGPILMAVGAFMLIAACVITLENRDSHARIIYGEIADERKKNKKKSESEADLIPAVRMLTLEEIRKWKPKKCRLSRLRSAEVKLLEKRKVLSVSCLPMLSQSANTKELYENLLNDYKSYMEDEAEQSKNDVFISALDNYQFSGDKEDVVAEVHAEPDDSDDSMLSATSSISGKVQLPSQEDICSVMSIAQMELYDVDEASFKDELSLVIRRDITADDMAIPSPHTSFSKAKRPMSACCDNVHSTPTKFDMQDVYYRFFSLPDFRNKFQKREKGLLRTVLDKNDTTAER